MTAHVEVVAGRRLETGNAQSRVPAKGPLILAKLIVSSLDRRKEGDYGELVEKLNCENMPEREMAKWLRALKLCVSHLNEDCKTLVAATLRLPWYLQSPSLVELYLDYLANLLSAQVCHVEEALSALTLALLGPNTLTLASKNEVVEQTYSNIHAALKTLLDTVPRAVPQLVPALNKQYPFRTRGTDIQEVAVKNCLHVVTYCPTVTEDILSLLINKMVTIDAEIRLEDDSSLEVASDEEEEESQFHVDMEQDQTTVTTAGDNASLSGCNTTPGNNGCRGEEEATPPRVSLGPSYSVRCVMRSGLSESLDIHMTVLQSYMRSTCFESGKLIIEEAVALLQTMFKIFSNLILPTHSISHVQFLLFCMTSFHKDFPGLFLDFLWKKFEDVNVSVVLRQTAAAYMASYIARSKFVSVETAKLCMFHMMQWLHQYLDLCDPDSLGPFVARHGPFFSLCQAVFYIFVFRHRSLVDMDKGLSFLRNLNFERIISSKLNPLRVCLPNVVEKFSKLASHHEVVFCYTILEANKRRMLILTASLGTQSVTHTNNHLDCFFPFDPYWLQRSGKVIRPLYQEWEGDDGTGDEGEGESEGRDGDDEDEDEDASSSVPSSCPSFSLDSYETTPTDHQPLPITRHLESFSLSPN